MRTSLLLGALALAAGIAAPAAAQSASPDSLAAWMRPGVSLGLAEHRARTISNVVYVLTLDVSARDRAVGHVFIQFRHEVREDVVVDFRGRRLLLASANGVQLPQGAANGAHIRVADQWLQTGVNTLEFAFWADIAPSGASIIRFHDRADDRDYLYTLLVPADANQLFPCFDQPDLKARVDLTLITPPAWTAFANGIHLSADTTGATVTHRFAETQPISTYLVAFAAGPWTYREAQAGPRIVRGYVRRSRAGEVDLDTLLVQNGLALQWMEWYFGVPYPFRKFEFLLAPAFPFGGMEHPGAIFYNEDRFIFPRSPHPPAAPRALLHRPARGRPPVVRRPGHDAVVRRPVAQGGFATYMAAKALDDLDSTAGAWKTFYLGNKPVAYGVDETAGTTPLWQELANLDQAKSNYGAIVYNKAPSVLKQLNYLVGEAAFRSGIRGAPPRALLRELHLAGPPRRGRRGGACRDLTGFGREFILRPGMPEVEQRLTVANGRIARLQLVQHPAQPLSGPGPWPMRTQVTPRVRRPASGGPPRRGERPRHRGGLRPRAAGARVRLRQRGGLRVLPHSPRRAQPRRAGRGALGRTGDPFLRAMLWGAVWDQVRAARMAPERFARLVLRELAGERDEQVLPGLLGRLGRTLAAYASPAARDRLRPEVERALWTGATDASLPTDCAAPTSTLSSGRPRRRRASQS